MKKNPMITLLLIAAIVYFILLFIWPYFSPLICAFLVLYMVNPPIERLCNKINIRKRVIVFFLFSCLVSLLILIFSFGLIPHVEDWNASLREAIYNNKYSKQLILYFESLGVSNIYGMVTNLIEIIGSTVFFLGAFVLSLFLLACDYRRILIFLKSFKEGLFVISICDEITSYGKAYLMTQVKLALIISAIAVPILWCIGIHNGYLLGFLAGVMDAIPIFGTGIVLVPTAIYQFLEEDYGQMVACIILYFVCAIVREILEPKFLGSAIKIPAIGIWASIYAGVQMFGVSGVFKGPIGFFLIYTIYRKRGTQIDIKGGS